MDYYVQVKANLFLLDITFHYCGEMLLYFLRIDIKKQIYIR